MDELLHEGAVAVRGDAGGLKLKVSFEEPPGEETTEAKREETKAALRELGLAEDLGPRERIPVVRDVTQPPCPAPEMPLVPKVFGSVEPPGLPPPCSTLPFPGGRIENAVLCFSNPTRLSQSYLILSSIIWPIRSNASLLAGMNSP